MFDKNENYDFLYDNGFFSNDLQIETVIVPIENKNEITFCEKNTLTTADIHKKNKLDTLLFKLWKASDIELGLKYMGLATLFIPVTCIIPYLKGEYDLLTISIIAHAIIYAFLSLCMFGDCIASTLYKIIKGIKKGQILYTVGFDYEIAPVEICDAGWDSEGNIIFKCTSSTLGKYIWLMETELFQTPELAADIIPEIQCQRIEVLQNILGDKTEAFLNGEAFKKYAKRYYLCKRVELDGCYSLYNHISIYDFLMSKESFITFCDFIKREISANEKSIQEYKAREKKEKALINDVVDTII